MPLERKGTENSSDIKCLSHKDGAAEVSFNKYANMEEIPEKWTTAHVVPRVKWSSSVSQLASINAS